MSFYLNAIVMKPPNEQDLQLYSFTINPNRENSSSLSQTSSQSEPKM